MVVYLVGIKFWCNEMQVWDVGSTYGFYIITLSYWNSKSQLMLFKTRVCWHGGLPQHWPTCGIPTVIVTPPPPPPTHTQISPSPTATSLCICGGWFCPIFRPLLTVIGIYLQDQPLSRSVKIGNYTRNYSLERLSIAVVARLNEFQLTRPPIQTENWELGLPGKSAANWIPLMC